MTADKTINNSANNKRIAKNTAMLYIRMLFTMAVSLYTSRVILATLGVIDYGIYNIVGGVLVLFSFINTTMINSTQRFLNFYLGKNDTELAKKVFSISLTSNILISIFFILFAETLGLWFLNTKLNIPTDRLWAANWVYQFICLSTCVNVIKAPYDACIVANERMSFYAYLSILDVSLKLLIVFLLTNIIYDKLITYSVLMLTVTLIVFFVCKLYSNRYFSISRYKFIWDKQLFKQIFSFSSWNLFGSIGDVAYQQGLNILLNIFCGVTLNAAMGIANPVRNAIFGFVANLQMASNPQIIKSFAAGDKEYFQNLIIKVSKYSYFLMFILSLPILMKIDFVLSLWLGKVPEHAVSFLWLTLVFSLIDALVGPLWVSIQATGHLKKYQIVMGFMLLMNLPLSYIALYIGLDPESILIIKIIIQILSLFVRLMFSNKMVNLSYAYYFKFVILKISLVSILATIPPLFFFDMFTGLLNFVIVSLVCVISSIISIYFLGLDPNEKHFVNNIVNKKINLYLKK